jgi:uncharacterized membrane protein
MEFSISEAEIEEEYHVSRWIIGYKMIFGIVELLLGVGIAFFNQIALHWYRIYATKELSEDPHDLLVRLTKDMVPNLLSHHTFLVVYLTLLGSAKIAGAIGLFYKQNWGVDLLVCLTILMFPFQIFQLITHPTFPDFLYIFMGLFISMYLVNFRPHEWARRLAKKTKHFHTK